MATDKELLKAMSEMGKKAIGIALHHEQSVEIEKWEKMLKRYNAELLKNPDSLFLSGLVKNTKELITELKEGYGSF
jgi:hypothetical protein